MWEGERWDQMRQQGVQFLTDPPLLVLLLLGEVGLGCAGVDAERVILTDVSPLSVQLGHLHAALTLQLLLCLLVRVPGQTHIMRKFNTLLTGKTLSAKKTCADVESVCT